jgi:hypothetical protein
MLVAEKERTWNTMRSLRLRTAPFALAAAMGASAVGGASGMRRRAWPAKIRSRINQQIAERGNAMLAWLRDLTSRECRTMLAC